MTNIIITKSQITERVKKAWILENYLTSLDRMIWGSAGVSIISSMENLMQGKMSMEFVITLLVLLLVRLNVLYWSWYFRAELSFLALEMHSKTEQIFVKDDVFMNELLKASAIKHHNSSKEKKE